MKKIISLMLVTISIIITSNVYAATCVESGVTIDKIRVVGNYLPDEKHTDTIELHHAQKSWCSLADCAYPYRVAIDASRTHLVGAAYMAFAAGKKVDITIDTALGTKNGICLITYLDVLN